MNADAPTSLGFRRPARASLPPFSLPPPTAIPRAAAADEGVTPDTSASAGSLSLSSSGGVRSPPGSSYSTLSSPGYSSSASSMSLSPYKTTPAISPVSNYQRRPGQEPPPPPRPQSHHHLGQRHSQSLFGEKLPPISSLIPPPGPSQYGPIHTPRTAQASGAGHLALPMGMGNMSLGPGQNPPSSTPGPQAIPSMAPYGMPHGLPTIGQSLGATSPGGKYHEFSVGMGTSTSTGSGTGTGGGQYSVVRESSQQDRPFKCDQCTQCFSRNHDLKRHKRIHMASKPFPCPHCDKCFSRKDALKRHSLVKACNGRKSPPQFLLLAPGPEPEPGPDLERGNSVGSSDDESLEYAKFKSPR
ncbi:hypothetical protein B0T22DRAFT_480368 [Podospora appendiculata]|uniref:C2H2-type domain-containing protein n=1 Tax=Podospora appendiculata TaxID=314037 RepID=A0AAE1CD31_9PEZI|nr:hypothetical protein B0T22DRAFT_480368 [Podospora appendiculata]